MPYVERSDQIPQQDLEKIRTRLVQQINSMNEAELKIAAQSEASFKSVLADLFRAVARTFGYTIGVIVGVVEDISRSVRDGWKDGFKQGRG